jgi:hypothetical protein
MPIEQLQSHDGENQQSDQASTRKDASSSNKRIRDFMEHQGKLYDQRRYKNKGKGMITQEVKALPQKEEIERVIKQRGGITSEGAEVRLGFDAKVRGGIRPIDFTTYEEDRDYDAADDDDSSKWTNRQRRAVRIRNKAKELIDEGFPENSIRSTISEYRE